MSRRLKFFIVSLVVLLGWIFLAPLLAENLIVEKRLEKADAILVLGGSSAYIERTHKAAELYRRGIAPKIFLTDDGGRGGWSPTEQINLKFVERARRSLIEQGVPPDAIEILEPTVNGTIDEARVLNEKVKTMNPQAILLVTSAYHTRRARWIFEKVLTKQSVEIGVESARTGIQTPEPTNWWLSPEGWRLVAGEYIKGAYYWANY